LNGDIIAFIRFKVFAETKEVHIVIAWDMTPYKLVVGKNIIEKPAASDLYPEAVGSMFFRNICTGVRDCMVPQPGKLQMLVPTPRLL
jgi:hypothetical protein